MSGVALVGGTLPLGLALGRRLLEEDRGPVVIVGREAEAAVDLPAGAIYAQLDVTRPREVRSLLCGPVRELGVETIVNLAFHRDPREPRGRRLNVEAARGLLHAASMNPQIRHFVQRSSGEVYVCRGDEPDLAREDRPLNHDPTAPAWIRERVEVDALVSARSGLTEDLRITVLRCAEIFAPDMGSQLWAYLDTRFCLRRMGFDPMLNLLSLPDAVEAFVRAIERAPEGPINIPGMDTLPLSRAIRLFGRNGLPLPGQLMGPAHRMRAWVGRSPFEYRGNVGRFAYNGNLDGSRARKVLGYAPSMPLRWPVAQPPAGARTPETGSRGAPARAS